MDQETRTKHLDKVKGNAPYSYKDIYYQGGMKKLPVHRIDLDYLVYNRWNGRIASLVKSYERENGLELDSADPKCYKIIEDFLWESNERANEATYESILDQGQKEYGIVTRDGVIIDGNRRAMLLRKKAKDIKEHPAFFLAVILDEKLFDNRKEIMRLETTYQMGEDAKVDYKPIEKYLKCKDMIDAKFKVDEIAKAMSVGDDDIKEYLEIMDLMDDYLENLGYSGIYTRLDKTEDLFINLNKACKKWRDGCGKMQWKCKNSDLSDLKLICFDYIRYVYNSSKGIDAKEVRQYLTQNSEEKCFFTQEKIWRDFSERHFEKIDTITKNEKSVDELRADSGSRHLSSILKSRDEVWAKQVDSAIKENFGKTREALENFQNQGAPKKLLESALDKLKAIDVDSRAFLDDRAVFELVDIIRKMTDEYKRAIITFQKHK